MHRVVIVEVIDRASIRTRDQVTIRVDGDLNAAVPELLLEGEQRDGEMTPRNLRECEAEAVALVCCAALDLPGIEESRGYIQAWWGRDNPIPERSAQWVLKVADQILKAGTRVRQAMSAFRQETDTATSGCLPAPPEGEPVTHEPIDCRRP